MSSLDLIRDLRALGVPDGSILGVVELIENRELELVRPKTSAERSKACRQRKRVENVAPALQNDTKTLQKRVAEAEPRARVLCGAELKNIPPEKASLSTPKGETKPRAGRGDRLAEGWRPNEAGRKLAVETLGSNAAARQELEKFTDHWTAKAGADARKADWDATWRNWVRRATERSGRGPPGTVVPLTRNGKISVHDALRDLQNELDEENPHANLFDEGGDCLRPDPPRLISAR